MNAIQKHLLSIIKLKGDCSRISCSLCPFTERVEVADLPKMPGKIYSRCEDFLKSYCCSSEYHVCSERLQKEGRDSIYNKCVCLYIEVYGKESLVEELL